jgi:hypothetical protein
MLLCSSHKELLSTMLARQHLFPIFRDPHQVYLQVVLRVRSQLVPFHATRLHDPYSSPARRGARTARLLPYDTFRHGHGTTRIRTICPPAACEDRIV